MICLPLGGQQLKRTDTASNTAAGVPKVYKAEMDDIGKNMYETIDSRCSPKNMRGGDVGLATFPTRKHCREKNGSQLGYVNQAMPVAPCNEIEYESPRRTDEPRRRARINEMYEGGDSSHGEQIGNVKIFEAIRDVDFGSSSGERSKGCCNRTCLALFFLSLLSAISFASSAYIFYKYDVQQLPMCTNNCGLPAHRESFNSKKNETNISMGLYLLSQQIEGINQNIRSLEKQLNGTKVAGIEKTLKNNIAELSKINESLNSGHYWAHSLERLKNTLTNKINESLNARQYWAQSLKRVEMTLSNKEKQIAATMRQMNWTTRHKIESLRDDLATKGSFKNCSLKIVKKNSDFSSSHLVLVEMPKKTPDDKMILGVGCTTTDLAGIDSQLEIKTDGLAARPVYKCAFELRKSPSKSSRTCIMYYWECPNN